MSLVNKLIQEITHVTSVIIDRSTPLKDSAKAYVSALLPSRPNTNLVVMLEGFEEAYVGTAERIDLGTVAVYSKVRCVEIIMAQEEVSFHEAKELFEYNVGNMWLGDKGPIFLTVEGE
tara:strand:+ start:765 stop:1118 length:354 start_codon:yes stop_codon:yes gene_type:complete